MFRYTPFDVSPWRLLDEMMDVDRRLNRVLQATSERRAGRDPLVNLYSGEKGAIVDAELPGVDPKNVEVSVENQILTIKGQRPGANDVAHEFERKFELPFQVAEAGLSAKYAQGILRITLPKAPEAKTHRIAIDPS